MNYPTVSVSPDLAAASAAERRIASQWAASRWLAAFVLASACGLGATSVRAQVGPMDFLFSNGVPRAADVTLTAPRVWKLGEYSALALQPREPGSRPNQQPVKLLPDALRMRLTTVEFIDASGRTRPLFTADELNELAPALARALAVALPGDDLVLMSTARRESGFLGLPLSIMARLFLADGELQLIVHSARADTLGMFRAAGIVPKLTFGRRNEASPVKLSSAQAVSQRGDWLAFGLAGGATPPPPAPLNATASAPALLAPESSGAPATAGASSALPVPSAATAPARLRDERYYEEQSQRLKGLQRLREQGLLSEAEYQQLRRVILQSL